MPFFKSRRHKAKTQLSTDGNSKESSPALNSSRPSKVFKKRAAMRSSTVTGSEMIKKIQEMRMKKKHLKAIELFKKIDEDGGGSLDIEEFKQLSKVVREFDRMSDADLEMAFAEIDDDNSKEISIQEFEAFYMEKLKTSLSTYMPYTTEDVESLKGPDGQLTYKYMRKYIYILLFGGDTPEENDKFRMEYPEASIVGGILVGTILLSTVAYTLETLKQFECWNGWNVIEYIVSSVFTLEYVLRIWAVRHRLSYIKRISAILDAISCLPFWFILAIYGGIDDGESSGLLLGLRTLRLARILRISRLEALEGYFQIFIDTMTFAKNSFTMIFIVTCMSVFCCSALTLAAERGSNLATFDDIFHAFYWCVVTMTTLGYGDIYPESELGRVMACVTVLVGILIMAFAINIVGSCFDEAYCRYLEKEGQRIDSLIQQAVAYVKQDDKDGVDTKILGGGKKQLVVFPTEEDKQKQTIISKSPARNSIDGIDATTTTTQKGKFLQNQLTPRSLTVYLTDDRANLLSFSVELSALLVQCDSTDNVASNAAQIRSLINKLSGNEGKVALPMKRWSHPGSSE